MTHLIAQLQKIKSSQFLVKASIASINFIGDRYITKIELDINITEADRLFNFSYLYYLYLIFRAGMIMPKKFYLNKVSHNHPSYKVGDIININICNRFEY